MGNTKNGTIVFGKTQEIKFESNNQDTVIDNVTFGGMSNGGKTIGIQLNTKDGMPASMMPGESVSLSYWVKLGAGAGAVRIPGILQKRCPHPCFGT